MVRQLADHLRQAPWHRDPVTTLEAICADMVEKIDKGECEADVKGLNGGTINKHFRKNAQVHEYMRSKVPAVAEFKELEVSPESRDDLLGHRKSGQGETRYAKAIRIGRLRGLVNMIPNVTSRLPDCAGITLLPLRHRQPRPQRQKATL